MQYSMNPDIDVFKWKTYEIPVDLAIVTGGAPETWAEIDKEHRKMYNSLMPILPTDNFLEIGCGLGRDAMILEDDLTTGHYIGFDVTADCITWARKNIRHKNFHFVHTDTFNGAYNPTGNIDAAKVRFPVKGDSIDKIVAHSVLTHMLQPDIEHYLVEVRRALKPNGVALLSGFIVNTHVAEDEGALTFKFREGNGFVQSQDVPEAATGYPLDLWHEMFTQAGLTCTTVDPGHWSGWPTYHGQDIFVLKRND